MQELLTNQEMTIFKPSRQVFGTGLFIFLPMLFAIVNLNFILIPMIIVILIGFQRLMGYWSFAINQDAIFVQKPFKKLEKVLEKTQIEHIVLRKTADTTVVEVVYHEKNEQKTLTLQSWAFQVVNASMQSSQIVFEELLKNLVKENPEKMTMIAQQDYQLTTNVLDKPIWGRVFLYGGLLIFAITLYVDMMIIRSLHFATDFLLPMWAIMAVFGLIGFWLLRNKQQKSSYMPSVAMGMLFGLIVSHAVKSYVHWSNENNPNLTIKYYPILLDDFDKQDKTQRWLFPDELQKLTQRERIYLRNSEVHRWKNSLINENLAENQSYLIPVKFGTFNDIMIDRRAFQHPQPVNNNEGINND